MAGFVYIMSNPSFVAGRIKIGKSDRDPEEYRKVELETTGVPEPFKVEYYAFVDDHHRIEKLLHETFDCARKNKQREYFDVSIDEVIREIKRVAQIKFEVNRYFDWQDAERRREETERARRMEEQRLREE